MKIDVTKAISAKWQKLGISALIQPVYPTCAFKKEHADDLGLCLDYIYIWNATNFASGVVPITQVQETEEEYVDELHDDKITKLFKATAEGSAGMPIGLQVVAHAFEDEKALAVMKRLEENVNYKLDTQLFTSKPSAVQVAEEN
jgi:Asp-tRNA(Asn)/Glu-tRNA(Gln) amidotransferase A subunit family amidase